MTLFRKHNVKNASGKKVIRTCAEGEIAPLERSSSDAISSKILGDGFTVLCSGSRIVSPADGELKDISDNGMTYGISLDDGVCLLVCIKRDSSWEVEPCVKVGQRLNAGDLLCTADSGEASVIVTNPEHMKTYRIAFGRTRSEEDGVIIYET